MVVGGIRGGRQCELLLAFIYIGPGITLLSQVSLSRTQQLNQDNQAGGTNNEQGSNNMNWCETGERSKTTLRETASC